MSGGLSKRQAEAFGLPEGYKQYTPFPFSGMNQKDSRYAMADQEFFWLENMIRTGNGNLHSVGGPAATPLYTATGGRTILSFFFYNIGTTNYCAVFFTDGTAVQVNTSSLAVTDISTVTSTFYVAAGAFPACVQSGTKYLLISNNNTPNDYWIWDGSILYTSGTLSPTITITGSGAGYATAPTITAYGGHGTGATFVGVIDAGHLVQIKCTNPGTGYQPGDVVGLRISGGGNSDSGAILTAVMISTTVASVEVTAGGHGYTSPPTVVFTGGGGASAAGTAVLTGGVVTSVTMTNNGSSYESAPTITFTGGGPGVGASARAYLTPTGLASVTVTSGGAGYWLPPTATLSGGGGVGASIRTQLQATSVAYIKITDSGNGYQSAPTIVINNVGTSATVTASATAQMNNGAIFNITMGANGSGYILPPLVTDDGTTGGLLPSTQGFTSARAVYEARLTPVGINTVVVGNQGDGYTDAPTILIDPGFNNAAYGTVEVMPYGVSGSSIETYQSRVWLTFPKAKTTTADPTGGTVLTSDASSFTDFPVITPNSGSVLRAQYNSIKQSNGYLYPIGDSSIDIISNVQTSGDPSITTFNFQNTEPQIGTGFPNTLQSVGRSIEFANQNGVFRIAGGAVSLLSEGVNNLYEDALFPTDSGSALTPSAATAYIHNIQVYLLLLTIIDPFTDAARNVMLAVDKTGAWYVMTQGTLALTYIGTQIINSDINAFGTNGTAIYQLFNTPSSTLEKVVVTKQYGADAPGYFKKTYNAIVQGIDQSSGGSGFTADLILNSEIGDLALPYGANLADPKVFTQGTGVEIEANFVGLTIGSTSPDFEIYNIAFGYTISQGPIGAVEGINAPAAT